MATIFTKDTVKPVLEKYNRDYNGRRTWGQMVGALDSSLVSANQAAERDFSTSVNDAYLSSMNARNAVAGASFGQGFKENYGQEIENALRIAYENSLANMNNALSSNQKQFNAGISNIAGAMDTEAANMAKYGNAHIDYIKALWDKAEAGELTTNPFESYTYSRFLNSTPMEGYNDYDENGMPLMPALKSESEIASLMFDKNGNLTPTGSDIIEQLENDNVYLKDYTFGQFLQDTDSDLFDWATSLNAYDTGSPDLRGNFTNRMAFFKNAGIENTDEQYNYLKNNKLNSREFTAVTRPLVGASDELDDSLKEYEEAVKQNKDLKGNIVTNIWETAANELEEVYDFMHDYKLTNKRRKRLFDSITEINKKLADTSDTYREFVNKHGITNDAIEEQISIINDGSKSYKSRVEAIEQVNNLIYDYLLSDEDKAEVSKLSK